MIEEDSRYMRNALGTRMTTYWLPDTREYLAALLKYFGTQRYSLCTYSMQNLQGRLRRPEGFKLHTSLSLSPTGSTVRDMGQGYLHCPYI